MTNSKNILFCRKYRHHSSTIKIKPAISFDKKTGEKIKLFKCDCSLCKKTKIEIVSENAIEAKGLGNFYYFLGPKEAKAAKKIS